jgi:hypothetical protein
MAEATIRLVVNPHSGKRDVIISYTSDEDAMPLEHEDEHRNLVDKLIEGGALKAAELGDIIVDRAEVEGLVQKDPQSEEQEQREAVEQDQ